MIIYEAKDYKDMSRKAANIISAQIIMKPNCVLGLATGSTPIGTYEQLVEWYHKGDLDFSKVTSVNLDEYRGLEKSNDQSYDYFMHEHLFDKVNIHPEKSLHKFRRLFSICCYFVYFFFVGKSSFKSISLLYLKDTEGDFYGKIQEYQTSCEAYYLHKSYLRKSTLSHPSSFWTARHWKIDDYQTAC